MSLRDLAKDRLARLHSCETGYETTLKQEKHASEAFHGSEPCFGPLKRAAARKSAENVVCFTVPASKGVKHETDPLPDWILAGLDRLRHMRAPRLQRRDIWAEVVADAQRLATGGWASQALALGWEPMHLWGCSAARGGIADLEGLAVRLAGRRIALIDATSCIIANGPRSFDVFNCRSMDGAVFLWELGGGGR